MGAATGAAGVPAHGDSLLLLLDVLEELDGAVQLPAVDGLGGLAGVLERDTQVRAAGAGRLGRLNLGSSVSDLIIENMTESVICSVKGFSFYRRLVVCCDVSVVAPRLPSARQPNITLQVFHLFLDAAVGPASTASGGQSTAHAENFDKFGGGRDQAANRSYVPSLLFGLVTD